MIFGDSFYNKRSIVNELKIDGKEVGDDEEQKDEFTVEDDENEQDTTGEENTTEEDEQQDDNTDDNQDDNTEEDEFKIDNDDETNTEDETNQDDTETANDDNQDGDDNTEEDEFKIDNDDETNQDDTETNTEDETNQDGDDNTEEDETNQDDVEADTVDDKTAEIEKDLFSSLSPEQQKSMNKELKNNFFKLFTNISSTYEKINTIDAPTEDTNNTLTRLMNTLDSMKEYIQDYLSTIYSSKTYSENMICFQKYLVIYKSIGKVLKEIESDIKNRYENDED